MTYTFAHRGGRAHGPDNEIPTFVAALARGATGLETDAWVTADGLVVLDHDGVHRAARRRQVPISQVRRTELPVHVPTLAELYAACGTDFELAVDVKSTAAMQAVYRVAQEHDAADRLWIFAHHSVAPQALERAHAAVTLRAEQLLGPGRSARLSALAESGIEAVNARWMWWHRGAVADVHEAGLLAFGYDAQRMVSLRQCVRAGLDGVFSDHVDRMAAVFPPP